MDASRLVFGVLGPLYTGAGVGLPVAGTKRRTVLGTLLLHPGEIVAVDDLADALWPTDPPRSARANIQTYVSGLRRCLRRESVAQVITTHGNGYRVEVGRDELDSTAFEGLLAAGHREHAQGQPQRSLRLLDEALRLWRGDVLADLPECHAWRGAVNRLCELRLGAIEQRARVRTALGQYSPAVIELRTLVDSHPFRESLWEHLLVALYAAGRRADALSAYGNVRDLLVAELGVEPGPQLRRIHREILHGTLEVPRVLLPPDPGSTVVPTQPGPGVPAHRALRPQQLPADIPDFTGRANHVRLLDELLTPGTSRHFPVVAVVVGPPGTGKSTLAVHAAHRARSRYPDGQLHVHLGGSRAPRAPGHVYREVLRALGVPAGAVPRRSAERASLYRSMLAQRRLLLLFDDATDARQVCELLPPDGSCAVLVTSRRHLGTVPGAHTVHLDTFTAGEGRQLLASIVGAERVDREPEDAASICRSCGYLPQAIRTAGGKLAARRSWSLRVLAARLADQRSRLDELSGDGQGLRASFELSVRGLPDEAATVFRLLGLSSVTPVPAWVVGALLGRGSAHEVVDALVDANLLQVVGPDPSGQPRYRLPDLLHCHAVELASREPETVRRGAVERLASGWLGHAERAAQRLPASVFRPSTGRAPRWSPDPSGAGRAVERHPVAWFDAERRALLEMVESTARWGLDELSWELAVALVPYFDHRSNYLDWRHCHRTALRAVRVAGNLHGEAALLRGLGQVQLYQDRYAQAAVSMRRSRALSRRIADRRGSAIAVVGLATVYRVVRDYGRALRCYRTGLAEVTRIGDVHCEAQVRNAMGIIHRELGEFDSAAGWFRSARQLARRIGDPHREASVLFQMAVMWLDQAQPRLALRILREAAGTFEGLGDEHCTGYVLEATGRARLLLGEPLRAQRDLEAALSIFRATGDRRAQATATELLGALHRARHDLSAASSCSLRATQLWRQIDGRPVAPLTSA